MTTFAGQSCPARESRQGGAQHLVFAWTLAAETAGRLGVPGGAGMLRLEVATPRLFECAPLVARLIGRGTLRELVVAAGEARWTTDETTALIHLEAPGVLHATLRATRAGFDVLYARTPLLTSLNIGAGRYEFENARLRDE